jgi:hypothetical protein
MQQKNAPSQIFEKIQNNMKNMMEAVTPTPMTIDDVTRIQRKNFEAIQKAAKPL